MRLLALVVVVSACVHRVDATRVTLRDPSELVVEGSGALPHADSPLLSGVVDKDVLLVGRPGDVLAFEGDTLRMHLMRDEVRHCHHGQRCDRRVLDLRVDTPLANVRAVSAVGVVADHHIIPLGLLAGGLLAGFGGGTLGYELAVHENVGGGPAPFLLAAGLAILAVELHARLARDTVTTVR